MGITHKILSFRILQYCIRNNDFKKITSLENTDLNYLIRHNSEVGLPRSVLYHGK